MASRVGSAPTGGIFQEVRIGYAGYVHDPLMGIMLARHRWYDPVSGRWLTRDPAGYVDGMSLYLFVKGNPLGLVDPTGLKAWGFWDGWGYTAKTMLGFGDQKGATKQIWSEAGKGAAKNPVGVAQGVYSIGKEVTVNAAFTVGAIDGDRYMRNSMVGQMGFEATMRGNGDMASGLGSMAREAAEAAPAALRDYGSRVASGDLEAIGDGAWFLGEAALGGRRLPQNQACFGREQVSARRVPDPCRKGSYRDPRGAEFVWDHCGRTVPRSGGQAADSRRKVCLRWQDGKKAE